MNVVRWADELKKTFHTYGPGAVLQDVGWRAVNKVASAQVLRGMTVRVSDVQDPTLFDAPGFEGRFVGADELEPYAAGAHEFTSEFVKSAMAHGDRCYAIFDGDKLASYGWYSNRPTPVDDHLLLHFDPAYTYMYKGFTAKAYRGKRLHAVGMCRALRAVTDEGKKGLISWVYSNNFASLRSTERMGYRIFGSAFAVRAGSHVASYATPGCREYGFWLEKLPVDGAV